VHRAPSLGAAFGLGVAPTPCAKKRTAPSGCVRWAFSRSGSLAMFTAIRRASSTVIACELAPCGRSSPYTQATGCPEASFRHQPPVVRVTVHGAGSDGACC
jgi:hypothetical protein